MLVDLVAEAQKGKQFVRLRPLNGLKEGAPNYNSAFVFVKAAAAPGGGYTDDEFRVTRNQPLEG